MAATVLVERTREKVASGRLVLLLYDPAGGQTGWAGVVCGSSPTSTPTWTRTSPRTRSSGRLGWTWLTEALGQPHRRLRPSQAATVTTVGHRGFSGPRNPSLRSTGFELRASWSPAGLVPPADPDRAPRTAGPWMGTLAAWLLCRALHGGPACHRWPRASRRCRRATGGPRVERTRTASPLEPKTSTAEQAARNGPPAIPLLEPRDGLPPLGDVGRMRSAKQSAPLGRRARGPVAGGR